jgi:hypothetical protein
MKSKKVKVHTIVLEMATEIDEEVRRTMVLEFLEVPAVEPPGPSHSLPVSNVEFLRPDLASYRKLQLNISMHSLSHKFCRPYSLRTLWFSSWIST